MLTSSNFKSNKNKQLLVIFSMASLFLFGLTLKTEAKVISVGTTTDTIYMGGSLGIGLTNPNSTLDVRNAISGDQLRFGQLNYTYSLGRDTSSGFLNFKGTQAGYTGYDFLSDDNIHLLTMIDNGNVGIGATTPYANLQIGQSTGGITFSSPSKIKIIGSPQSTTDEIFLNLVRDRNPNNQFSGAASFRLNSFTGGTGGAPPTSQLTIALKSTSDNTDVANVDVMTLRDNGNVGIGATAPGTKLDIAGAFRNSLATTHSLLGNSGNVVVMADNTGALYTVTQASLLSGATNFWGGTKNGNIWNGDAGAGNVGIGTTAPGSKLTISGGNIANYTGFANVVGFKMMEDLSGGNAALRLYSPTGGSPNTQIFQIINNRNRLDFGYAAKDRDTEGTGDFNTSLSINSGGNVGVGTTGPFYSKFQVAGDITNNIGYKISPSAEDIGAAYLSYTNSGDIRFNMYGYYGHSLTTRAGTGLYILGSNGNVGIGATNPGYKLDVAGSARMERYIGINSLVLNSYATINPASNVFLYSQPNDRDSWIYLDSADTGSNWGIYHRQIDSAVSGLPGNSIGFIGGGSSSLQSYISLADGSAYFKGNVGIGNSAPGTKLDVSGTFRNSLATTHSLLAGSGNVVVMADNSGTLYTSTAASSLLWSGTTGGNIWSANSGNVGIGTTAPSGKLHVASTGTDNSAFLGLVKIMGANSTESGTGAFDESKPSYGIEFRRWWTPGGVGYENPQGGIYAWGSNNWGGGLAFRTAASGGTNYTRMVIADQGNVGIGTTNPLNKLSVVRDNQSAPSITADIMAYGNASALIGARANTSGVEFLMGVSSLGEAFIGSMTNHNMSLRTNNTNRLTVSTAGYVGIGKTNPGANLDVVGTINSSMSVNSTSLCIGGVCKTDWNSLVPITGNVTLTGPLTIPGLSLTGDLDLTWHNIRNVTKLTVGTIDPLYNIHGVNYATFAPSIAGGVKEEYTGNAEIKSKNIDGEYEFVVDFNKEKEGSDLWVWRHTVDFSKYNIQVLLTPYGKSAQIYYLIENDKLIFRANEPVEISYRLVGNRIDWKKWPTRALDQNEKPSFIIK